MYKEGEYIVYGLNGVCLIESITTLDMKDVPKDVEYYSLIPLGQGGKIYVRVDSSQDNMRPVISKDEAERLIKQIDEIEAIKITDEKYMRLAEKALYSELAIALGISKNKVLEIIMSYH